MSKIILSIIGISVITLFGCLVIFHPYTLQPEYVASVNVDQSEKVEHVLTNIVNDVKSRNFIVSEIQIRYFPLGNSYKISVGGITHSKLLTFGD